MAGAENQTSRTFGAVFIILALLLALWTQLTPLGASPDESAHFIKSAAVIRGELKGDDVPAWLLSIDGWAFDAQSGVAEILVVNNGELVHRAVPDVLRADVSETLGIDSNQPIGFSIHVVSDTPLTKSSIFARLNSNEVVTLKIDPERNILTSPTGESVLGSRSAVAAKLTSLVEDSHINGRMEYSHWATYVDIPRRFDAARGVQACFVAQATKAACGLNMKDIDLTIEISERPLTTMGRYTPLIYLIPGLGTLAGPTNFSWYLARLSSATFGALLLGLAIMVARQRRGSQLPLLIAIAPAVVFLNSVVSPNGIEIASAIALWVTLPGMLEATSHNKWEAWCFGLGGIGLILARPLGMVLYLLVVTICVVASAAIGNFFRFVKQQRAVTALHALLLIFSTWWYVFIYDASVNPRRTDYLNIQRPTLSEQIIHSAFNNVTRALHEAIGDVGSLEVGIPSLALTVQIMMFAWVISHGWRESVRAVRRALVGLTLVTIALVIATDVNYMRILGGYGIQGRHITPLLVGLPLLAARKLMFNNTSQVTLVAVWGVTQFLAGFTALRRYSVGMIGDNFFEMFYFPLWKPPLLIVPTLTLLAIMVVTISYGALCLERQRTASSKE
ncbi:MAG: DUF2142 domain-containing protein [Actinomycetota bacterium]